MVGENTRSTVALAVDDDENIRKIIRRILEAAGFVVLEAASAEVAIALVEQIDPLDLIIADVRMSGIHGVEMAQRIRATHPNLKVLFVTGRSDAFCDGQASLSDGQAVLDKPFTAVGLLEAVSVLLYGTLKRPQDTWQSLFRQPGGEVSS